MKFNSIRINAFLSSIQRLLNVIFPLITFPYISHTLSVESVGKYNFSSSVVGYFILIAGLGINTFAVREGARFRNDRKKISQFASEVFTINLLAALISYILLFLCLVYVKKLQPYCICILILSIQIIFTVLGTEWVYVIFEEYTYITIRNIAFKIFSIFLMFLFVRNQQDYLYYAIITLIANAGAYVLNFINCKNYCDLKITLNVRWIELLKPILIIFASNIAIQIYVNADTTMLGLIKDDYTVGIYGVAVKIYTIIANLLGGILVVTIPRLSMFVGQSNFDEYRKLLEKLIKTLYILTVPCMMGLLFLSKDVIILIAGDKYVDSAEPLKILCLALTCKIFSTIFNDCVLIPMRREVHSMCNFIMAAIINIILNLCLIPQYGVNGAAFTTLLAEGFTTMANYYCGRDIINKSVDMKKSLKLIVSVCVGIVVIGFVCITCKIIFKSSLVRIFLSAIISAFSYFSVLFLLKNPIILEFINSIQSILNTNYKKIKKGKTDE